MSFVGEFFAQSSDFFLLLPSVPRVGFLFLVPILEPPLKRRTGAKVKFAVVALVVVIFEKVA